MDTMNKRCFELMGKLPSGQNQPTPVELESRLSSFGAIELWWPEFIVHQQHTAFKGVVLYVETPKKVRSVKKPEHIVGSLKFHIHPLRKKDSVINNTIRFAKETKKVFFPAEGKGADYFCLTAFTSNPDAGLATAAAAEPIEVALPSADAPDARASSAGAGDADVEGPSTSTDAAAVALDGRSSAASVTSADTPDDPALAAVAPLASVGSSAASANPTEVALPLAVAPVAGALNAGAVHEVIAGPSTSAQSVGPRKKSTRLSSDRKIAQSAANTPSEMRMTRSHAAAMARSDTAGANSSDLSTGLKRNSTSEAREPLRKPRQAKRDADTAGLGATDPRPARSRLTDKGRRARSLPTAVHCGARSAPPRNVGCDTSIDPVPDLPAENDVLADAMPSVSSHPAPAGASPPTSPARPLVPTVSNPTSADATAPAPAVRMDFEIGVCQALAFAIRAAEEAFWAKYDRLFSHGNRREDHGRVVRVRHVITQSKKVPEAELVVKKPVIKTYSRKRK